jgi:hypothetical protein
MLRVNACASRCAHAGSALVPVTPREALRGRVRRASVDAFAVRILSLLVALTVGCGARTGLLVPDAPSDDASEDVRDVIDVDDSPRVCRVARDVCEAVERCDNGLDDNCDGRVDEGCACVPGEVRPCFAGPPGRRNVGACRDGTQRCLRAGTGGAWSACEGGITPRPEVCNGVDDSCSGCLRETNCPISCPGADDPRVPEGRPFAPYALRGGDFFPSSAARWQWTVRGGPCDSRVARPSFTLTGADTRDAVFLPRLSGDYTVTLTVVTRDGETRACTFVVHVAGPGLRIELCWDLNETVDIDLYVRGPRGWGAPWWEHLGDYVPNLDSCSWANCEAVNRAAEVPIDGGLDFGGSLPRADWGYARSPLSSCIDGPLGGAWRNLGYCGNPRLDVDNNTSMGRGRPENINIDAPRDGDRFRVMAHNFGGHGAHPIVNIYCGGRRYATYGEAPDLVPGFDAIGGFGRGAVWRAVDVTTRVDRRGAITCELAPVHPPGQTTGYDVTIDEVRF